MESSCTFLQAIARMEGFPVSGSRANRNNNPGNIEYGRFSRAHGATPSNTDGRFAVFPSAQQGFACMAALFAARYRGLTVKAAIAKWAPPDENNTDEYIANVCLWSRLSPESLIDTHLGVPAQVTT